MDRSSAIFMGNNVIIVKKGSCKFLLDRLLSLLKDMRLYEIRF